MLPNWYLFSRTGPSFLYWYERCFPHDLPIQRRGVWTLYSYLTLGWVNVLWPVSESNGVEGGGRESKRGTDRERQSNTDWTRWKDRIKATLPRRVNLHLFTYLKPSCHRIYLHHHVSGHPHPPPNTHTCFYGPPPSSYTEALQIMMGVLV